MIQHYLKNRMPSDLCRRSLPPGQKYEHMANMHLCDGEELGPDKPINTKINDCLSTKPHAFFQVFQRWGKEIDWGAGQTRTHRGLWLGWCYISAGGLTPRGALKISLQGLTSGLGVKDNS
jgi:hypothetical protein